MKQRLRNRPPRQQVRVKGHRDVARHRFFGRRHATDERPDARAGHYSLKARTPLLKAVIKISEDIDPLP